MNLFGLFIEVMTFWDIVWVIIISISISVACWYSKIE